MKRMFTILFLSLTLFTTTYLNACCKTENCIATCSYDNCAAECNTCCSGHPFFSIRSQSWNAARELVGWQQFINQFEMGKTYGAFSVTTEYTRSFKPCRLASFLFGQDFKTGYLTISGSRKGITHVDHTTTPPTFTGSPPAREDHEWLADYFGLPTDFESKVRFQPRISNFIVNFNLYLGFDELAEGLFFKIDLPLVHTKWELNMCEETINPGILTFDPGYMSSIELLFGNAAAPTAAEIEAGRIERAALPENFTAAMKGVIWGDMRDELRYGKIDCCKLSKTRPADIHLTLGYNFLQDDEYHFGLMIRGAIPAGNKPKAIYLFEPMVGNGGHFELGAGITGHTQLWESDDESDSFALYFDAYVAHLFKRRQMRSFDLKNKPNSRYMLISELATPATFLYLGTDGADGIASAQYAKNLYPLINKSTCCTDVSIPVQGEAVLKCAYTHENFTFDFGYNFWARSGEKLCDGCTIEENKYALKGDAFVVGWGAADNTNEASQLVPLSATQSKADIHSGTNTPSGTPFEVGHLLNPGVDSATAANTRAAADHTIVYRPGDADASRNTNTSGTPVFLKSSDFDTDQTPSALSHKLFIHFSYAWKKQYREDDDDDEENGWNPFIGVGGEVEFGGSSSNCYNAVSQWGVWVKGGWPF